MPTDPVAAIGASLTHHGYAVTSEQLDGRSVLVGRNSEFRWRWFAVRLHTFVVVARFSPDPGDVATLDRFADEARRWALANKGGLPSGLQTGTAAVVVAVMDGANEVAVQWATVTRAKRFAVTTYPVVADITTGRVVHPRRMVVGAVFNSYLRDIAEEIVAPALGR
jgi:hypothetical protein